MAGGPIELRIDHQCPQCGAPAVLEESDRLYHCPYCKVQSYLLPRDVHRYLLPDKAPQGQALTYVPYWRFKGIFFTCDSMGIRHRVADLSRCAVTADVFPASLGLRSQAMHLRLVTPETRGRFLIPALGRRDAVRRLSQNASFKGEERVFLQSQVGESLSLIYAPVYQTDGLYDAVLNRPLKDAGAPLDLDRFPGGQAEGRFRFVPAICPSCGWNLDGRRDSLVLICRNCDRVWQASRQGLAETRIAQVPADGAPSIYLPFWRIRARVEGAELASYGDLVRLANLPRVLQPDFEAMPFRFWFPAFKVRPSTLLHLSRSLSLSQPLAAPVDRLPQGEMFPVNLPLSEAAANLRLVLAAFAKPPRQFYPKLPQIRVNPQAMILVYIPFSESVHEYLQNGLNLAVNKSQLALAGHL